MINGAMHVDGIHDRAAELHEEDRAQLILEPKNKYDNKAILVKNEKVFGKGKCYKLFIRKHGGVKVI